MDRDNSGSITVEELKDGLRKQGSVISEQELATLVSVELLAFQSRLSLAWLTLFEFERGRLAGGWLWRCASGCTIGFAAE